MPALEGPHLAHYELLERVGAGAMGVVWKAQDTRLKRLVALKALAPVHGANPVSRARLAREAQAASQLDHPNIGNIFQVEELPGNQLIIVMAFYEGETLAERLRRETLPPEEAVDIAVQLLSGLDHAHGRGVIHRDVKPANLILAEGRTVKIVDFGLAKELSELDQLTTTGSILGTVHYMSPEQVLCYPLDGRADLWACGVVLYEMLCGVSPFSGESTYGVFEAILRGQPKPLTEHVSGLPEHLGAVLERALDKNIQRRFQTAREFLQALRPPSEMHPFRKAQEAIPLAGLHVAAPATDRSLVVLPFTSPDTDGETQDFCDGLADEIITDLSGVHSLRTICSASSMRLRDAAQTPAKIAAELRVRYVLRGTVRLGHLVSHASIEGKPAVADRTVRVTVQLIDPQSDSIVWGDKYRGSVEDLFAIQETISRQIVSALKVTLTPKESLRLEQRAVPDLRALQFYVKAKHEILNYSREGLDRALEYLELGEAAVGKNPLLLSARGQAYWQYVNAGISSDPEYLRKARACAVEAEALAPDSAHVLRLLGLISVQEGKTQEGVLLLKRAIAADPNDSDSLSWYGPACGRSGKAYAAMPLARRILQIDPLTPVYRFVPGLLAWMAGEFADAVPSFDEALRLDPGNAMLLWFRGHVLALDGKTEEAIAQFKSLNDHCSDHYFCQLGNVVAAALRGDVPRAQQLCTESFETITGCDPHYSWALAECYSLLGEGATAVKWLETAVSHGFLNYPMIRRWDPLLANARRDAAFPALLERVRVLWERFEV